MAFEKKIKVMVHSVAVSPKPVAAAISLIASLTTNLDRFQLRFRLQPCLQLQLSVHLQLISKLRIIKETVDTENERKTRLPSII